MLRTHLAKAKRFCHPLLHHHTQYSLKLYPPNPVHAANTSSSTLLPFSSLSSLLLWLALFPTAAPSPLRYPPSVTDSMGGFFRLYAPLPTFPALPSDLSPSSSSSPTTPMRPTPRPCDAASASASVSDLPACAASRTSTTPTLPPEGVRGEGSAEGRDAVLSPSEEAE